MPRAGLLRNDNGIRVRYIYSACIVTTTNDVKILHDPWFTEGIYDGSWFPFPVVEDPIRAIGNVDLIYVSHIHPDHYDPKFLKTYFSAYGPKRVLIADHDPNHLARKMRADGIAPTIVKEPMVIGDTRIEIIPHKTGSVSDIDSAIVLKYFDGTRDHCVANVNDIIFDDAMLAIAKSQMGGADILLCGYTGAGPYPQTYFDIDDPNLAQEAERKRLAFLERYRRLTDAVNAKVNIPFAGKYVLGGKLANLNAFRGVSDATDVLTIDKKAAVLADDGGEIGTWDLKPSKIRTGKYPAAALEKRLAEIRLRKMDYERLIPEAEIGQLPIKRLLATAARRANERSECDCDYFFVFRLSDEERALVNANRAADNVITFIDRKHALPEPRSELEVDPRYLFGLLTNIYHWNNAEIGSQYNTRRFPNQFNRNAQGFLNFLSV